MQLKTILNYVEPHKSFVYQKARWADPETKTDDRDPDRAAGQRPSDLLGLRSAGAGLRPSGRAAIRVRAVVADRGLLRLRDAAGGLSDVRREGGASSLVRRQEPADDDLPLVPGRLGEAALVERGGRGLWHDVAERVPLGKTRCFVGFGAPRPGRHRGDWRRRSAVAEGAQVPDVGLPDRRGLQAAVVDRPGPDEPRRSCDSSGCWAKSVRAS